jgi:uncharacterized protein
VKRVQDPVHGLMEFRGMESLVVELLQTPELRRLRRIRQLGLAHLVFPGAEHSRFVHVLGASHLAGRFAASLISDSHDHLPQSLQPDETIIRDLVVAALCHDLGHGPLSHAWEHNVVGDFDRAAWIESLGLVGRKFVSTVDGWHELVTQALLLADGPLHRTLENVDAGMSERVAALLTGHFYMPYLTRLFASDVDVDRCDFILRDAYQTGVAYGRYDLDWLVSTITVGVDPGSNKPVLGFDMAKAPRVVEQLLIARRALYDTVYHHRAVRSAEGMVGLLLRRTHEIASTHPSFLDGIQGFDALARAISGEALAKEEVLELDDDSLWVFIRRLSEEAKDDAVQKLASRVLARDLFKPVIFSPQRLTELLGSAYEDTMAKVDHVIEGLGYTPAESFRLVDEASFSFFHTKEGEESWFVDTKDQDRKAQQVSTHEALIHHPREPQVQRTLFVPGDALQLVGKALSPQSSRR